VVGELYLGGAGLARAYHRRPAGTAEHFLPDPFGAAGARMYRTGDLAEMLPDGEVAFHGRTDRQVKVRGFRIELGELESVLNAHPQVGGAAVVAAAAGADEKRLVAYVTGSGGARPAVSELRSWAAERLPAYALPATYVVLDAFTLDSNGKIDRRALPEPWAARSAVADLSDYAAPRTDLERTIATACADALELDLVGVHDNFFALGGDSLRSVAVLERLRAHGVELTAADFFGAPTVAELAALVVASGTAVPTLAAVDG
jgi:aryl carrier-like protein